METKIPISTWLWVFRITATIQRLKKKRALEWEKPWFSSSPWENHLKNFKPFSKMGMRITTVRISNNRQRHQEALDKCSSVRKRKRKGSFLQKASMADRPSFFLVSLVSPGCWLRERQQAKQTGDFKSWNIYSHLGHLLFLMTKIFPPDTAII